MAKTRSTIIYQAPIGPFELVASEYGITSVNFLFGQYGKKLGATETEESSGNRKVEQNEENAKATLHLDTCKTWMDAYFNGTLLEMNPSPQKPPLVLPGKGHFFSSVWDALLSTCVGDTLSYKELATLSGSPLAARAVGQAVKKHCLPILVPCHRVVRSGENRKERAGGYSGGDGTATKEWLLEHERKMARLVSY